MHYYMIGWQKIQQLCIDAYLIQTVYFFRIFNWYVHIFPIFPKAQWIVLSCQLSTWHNISCTSHCPSPLDKTVFIVGTFLTSCFFHRFRYCFGWQQFLYLQYYLLQLRFLCNAQFKNHDHLLRLVLFLKHKLSFSYQSLIL